MKTLTLLGAGASHEAGLPISVELTKRIADEIQTRYRYSTTGQALHAIIGAIIAHDTGRGGQAFDGVDVERVFAAVQMLARRDQLEIAPFVTSWNRAIDSAAAVTPALPAFWDKHFVEEIATALTKKSPSRLGEQFTRGVEALIGPQDGENKVLLRLRDNMLAALRGCLVVDPLKVDYLAPLLGDASDVTDIVTLNYDNSIEILCNRADRVVDTGADEWDGSYSWRWSSKAEVRLLKMHGSLDWMLQTRGEHSLIQTVHPRASKDANEWRTEPVVVFGQGSKLRADGPFLGMLVEFERLLTTCDRLVVVGYSFRDDHVNEVITRWLLKGGEGHQVVVIDPAVDEWHNSPREASDLFKMLDSVTWEPAKGPNEPPVRIESRHVKMSMGAGEGLREVFGASPVLHDYVMPDLPPDDEDPFDYNASR